VVTKSSRNAQTRDPPFLVASGEKGALLPDHVVEGVRPTPPLLLGEVDDGQVGVAEHPPLPRVEPPSPHPQVEQQRGARQVEDPGQHHGVVGLGQHRAARRVHQVGSPEVVHPRHDRQPARGHLSESPVHEVPCQRFEACHHLRRLRGSVAGEQFPHPRQVVGRVVRRQEVPWEPPQPEVPNRTAVQVPQQFTGRGQVLLAEVGAALDPRVEHPLAVVHHHGRSRRGDHPHPLLDECPAPTGNRFPGLRRVVPHDRAATGEVDLEHRRPRLVRMIRQGPHTEMAEDVDEIAAGKGVHNPGFSAIGRSATTCLAVLPKRIVQPGQSHGRLVVRSNPTGNRQWGDTRC
jgi:hypothetical protein